MSRRQSLPARQRPTPARVYGATVQALLATGPDPTPERVVLVHELALLAVDHAEWRRHHYLSRRRVRGLDNLLTSFLPAVLDTDNRRR